MDILCPCTCCKKKSKKVLNLERIEALNNEIKTTLIQKEDEAKVDF